MPDEVEAPAFVPVDELHASPRQDGTIALWAVSGGHATHETVVRADIAAALLDEIAEAICLAGAVIGTRG